MVSIQWFEIKRRQVHARKDRCMPGGADLEADDLTDLVVEVGGLLEALVDLHKHCANSSHSPHAF